MRQGGVKNHIRQKKKIVMYVFVCFLYQLTNFHFVKKIFDKICLRELKYCTFDLPLIGGDASVNAITGRIINLNYRSRSS